MAKASVTSKTAPKTKKPKSNSGSLRADTDGRTAAAWFKAHCDIWQANHEYVQACMQAGASHRLDEYGFPVDRSQLSRAQQMAVDRANSLP